MSDITLYGFPASSYTWSARMAAEEKGISHDLEPIEFGSDAHKALHPFAKIPIMTHGEVTLYETAAICHYIDQTFDGASLAPASAAGQANMLQWNSAIVDYYYDWCTKRIVIQRLVVPNRGGTPDEDMIADAVPHTRHCMAVADEALKSSAYLAGDEPSTADFLLTPIANYMGAVPEGETVMEGLSALADWLARMQARPSFALTAPSP
jgi:glutathione S-transferase